MAINLRTTYLGYENFNLLSVLLLPMCNEGMICHILQQMDCADIIMCRCCGDKCCGQEEPMCDVSIITSSCGLVVRTQTLLFSIAMRG